MVAPVGVELIVRSMCRRMVLRIDLMFQWLNFAPSRGTKLSGALRGSREVLAEDDDTALPVPEGTGVFAPDGVARSTVAQRASATVPIRVRVKRVGISRLPCSGTHLCR